MNSLVCEDIEIDPIKIENYLQKIDEILEPKIYLNDTLLSGNLGKVLYFMYRYRTSDNTYFADLASKILGQVLENIREKKGKISFTSSLSSGLTGLCFINMLLEDDDFMDLEMDKTFAQFDKIIFEKACQQIKEGNLDYLHGSMGSFSYFTNRIEKNIEVKGYISVMIDLMTEKAIENERGIRFNNLIINQLNNTPDEINLGFAHGLSGILSVLLKVYESGINQEKVENIIRKGIRYILNSYQEVDFEKGFYSHFPSVIDEKLGLKDKQNQQSYRSFLGWCYGDLNQVILLYQAGKLFNELLWIHLAEKVGMNTMNRTLEKGTQIKDGFICHGAVGLALMYQHIINTSENRIYQEKVDYWQNQTLNYAEQLDFNLESNGSLLGGLEGLGLGLMTLQTDKNLLWTRLFLLQ